MATPDILEFTERLVSLIDTTRYSATYKLATLTALFDLAAEHTDPQGGAPTVLSGLEVGHRVVEMYWPQTAPYGANSDGGDTLRQSPQNDIPTKLAAWRAAHGLDARCTLDDARSADPQAWDRLERELAATVVRMPLAKLQRFGEGRRSTEDRFLYDFTWKDEVAVGRVLSRGFDDRITFAPGVGELLVRLAPLLRPLLQTRWAELVAARNADIVDSYQLQEFLFGATRISLDRIRDHLVAIQSGQCFYCAVPMSGRAEVDHFIPWSRYPDNTLDNLVAAHPGCNNSKSASLAGTEHLSRWMERFRRGSRVEEALSEVAETTPWPRRPERTLSRARASYLFLKPGTRIWVSRRGDLEDADPDRVESIFAIN